MSNKIFHKRFICTESEYGTQGHNKFWYVTVYDDGDLETEYGRVGEPGKTSRKSFGSIERATVEAEKAIKKKQKGKPVKGRPGIRDSIYDEIEVASIIAVGNNGKKAGNSDLGVKASEQIAKGDKEIEKLVGTFVKTNKHNITSNTTLKYDEKTGLFSTPVGVVGQSNINQARKSLAKIRTAVESGKTENPKLIDEYLRLVPQDVGRKRPSIDLICPNLGAVDKQVSILDSLQASLDMINKVDDVEDQKNETPEEKIWDITIKLNDDQNVLKMVEKLYNKTRQRQHACHSLNVSRIFDIDHAGMTSLFDNVGSKIGSVWKLWHGTRIGNILSILSKGMIIPPANASHCAGRMFGDGLYFSDQSTKSLNYAYGFWDGGSRDNVCYMFLVDVAMGKHYTPRSWSERLPKSGYDSTFAKAGVSGVRNNEMIVYKTAQAKPRYLVEFK